MLPTDLWRFLVPFVALAMLLVAMDTCPHTVYSSTAWVTVFEDRDGNGEQGSDEPGIPDALVLAVYNTYGAFTRDVLRTDTAGQATFSAQYTNVFNVEVVPPCGTRATTATFYDLSGDRSVNVAAGFVAETPRSGLATVRFHLWDDQDGDGVHGSGEADLGNVSLLAAFHSGSATNYGADALRVTTDASGRATLELGNSCGTLWLWVPLDWVTSSIAPGGEREGEWTAIPYDVGTTEVEWGLQAAPTPTLTFPTPTP